MKKTDKIKIDTQMLVVALEDNSGMGDYYLNLKSGKIELISRGFLPEQEEIKKEIEELNENFLDITPIPSSKSYQIMVSFVEQLKIEKIKIRMLNVLNRKKPFDNFKNTLLNFPEIREQWFRYHDEKMKEIAREWLNDHQINADLM